MKSLFAVYSLVGILALGIWVMSAVSAKTNFSGTWVLDKEKTPNLPPQLESYTMIVTQNDRQLTVETKIAGDFRPGGPPGGRRGGGLPGDRPGAGVPAGRPGAGRFPGGEPSRFPGGGGGAFGMGMPTATYRLDGKETTMELTEGIPGTVTLKAKWKNDRQVLELTTTRYMDFQGNDVTMTTKERWELVEGGKVLKAKRTTETPMGAQESELIFNKQ